MPPAAPRVVEAIAFAVEAHGGQSRKDGRTPYVVHPIAVLRLLSTHVGVRDPEVLQAAALHDVLEDTPVTAGTIRERFGARVLHLVEELTLPANAHGAKVPTEVKTRHLVDALGTISWEAVLIKLCDRTDNLSDVSAAPWSHEKAQSFLDQSGAMLQAVLTRSESSPEPPEITPMLERGLLLLRTALSRARELESGRPEARRKA